MSAQAAVACGGVCAADSPAHASLQPGAHQHEGPQLHRRLLQGWCARARYIWILQTFKFSQLYSFELFTAVPFMPWQEAPLTSYRDGVAGMMTMISSCNISFTVARLHSHCQPYKRAAGSNGINGHGHPRSAASSLPGTPPYSGSSPVSPRRGTGGSAKAGNLLQQLPTAPVYKFSIVSAAALLWCC